MLQRAAKAIPEVSESNQSRKPFRMGGQRDDRAQHPGNGQKDTDPGFPASEPLENQGLQTSKIDLDGKRRELALEQINEVTLKLTDGRGSIAWSGDRSGGYRTNRAVAWLMGIGNGRWIVRYRNKASKPMKLPAAKRYAVEMVKGIRPGRVVTDPIGDLNRMQAVLAEYEAANNGE